MGSKLKAYPRKTAARTQEALEEPIAKGLALVSTQDAAGWFKAAGFQKEGQI